MRMTKEERDERNKFCADMFFKEFVLPDLERFKRERIDDEKNIVEGENENE